MAAKKERASLQSDLLSAKGQNRRGKTARAKAQVLLDAASAARAAGVAAACQSLQAMLCDKGSATAAGFRPWHWSYERVTPPPAPAASAAVALPESIEPAPNIASAPNVGPSWNIAPAPADALTPMPPPPMRLPTPKATPAFAYPCNSSTAPSSSSTAVADETPSVADHSADRALWLATSKTIAGLIGRELDGREAAAAARLEQQHRAESHASAGGRSPSPVTADGLIAELQTARRGSVRELRKGRRTVDATFVGLCVAMIVSAGVLSYALTRSDGVRFAWLAASQTVRPSLSFASGSLPSSIMEIARN